MSALDAVIRMRALEAEEKKMQQQNVANVFGAFQKARETSMLMDLEKQKLDASLAKSGLRFGVGGQIEADKSLLDDLGVQKEWKPTTKEEAFEYAKIKKKPTDTQAFREDLKRMGAGDISESEMIDLYPDKAEKVREAIKQTTPVKKSPTFQEQKGIFGKIMSVSRDKAVITDAAQRIIDNIKTQADLDDFLEDKQFDYDEDTANIVMEYFGVR